MQNLRWGVLGGSVVAGPTLSSLVWSGDLDAGTATARWAAVVAACTLGVAGLRRVLADYEQQARTAAALEAADDGPRVVLEGTPLPGPPRPTSPERSRRAG